MFINGFLMFLSGHSIFVCSSSVGVFLLFGTSFPTTTQRTQHFSQIQGARARRVTHSHGHKATDTYYINTKLGRTPKKHTVEELHTATTHSLSLSMALQPFGIWPIFQFLNPIYSR
jgi:hypothetical protein